MSRSGQVAASRGFLWRTHFFCKKAFVSIRCDGACVLTRFQLITCSHIIIKLAYMANSILQFYIMQKFIGSKSPLWGIEVCNIGRC